MKLLKLHKVIEISLQSCVHFNGLLSKNHSFLHYRPQFDISKNAVKTVVFVSLFFLFHKNKTN
jgi:hypothetical protein